MNVEIHDIVKKIADDVKSNIPNGFKEKYYSKMAYSNINKMLDFEEEILLDTISFEVAFIHIICLLFTKSVKCEYLKYYDILKKIDVDNLFSWYQVHEEFIISYIEKIDFEKIEGLDEIINSHDTYISKDVKKKLGQFYTPANIAHKMVSEIHTNIKQLRQNELIIDPACGTGVFLVEAINKIHKFCSNLDIIEYVDNNVFAYDVNPFAVVATKINILFSLVNICHNDADVILHNIFSGSLVLKNVQWNNTIVEPDNNKYAIILGNPPYFKLNKELIRKIKGYEDIIYGQPNIYSFFVFWATEHVQKDGVISLIVPQSIRSGLYFKKLREIMKNWRIKNVIHIDSRQNVFDRAEQAVLIICMENKTVSNSKTKIQFYNGDGQINTEFKIPCSKLMSGDKDNYVFIISKKIELYSIFEKIGVTCAWLESEEKNVKFSNGLFVWNQHKKSLVDNQNMAAPIVYGGAIQPLEFNYASNISDNKTGKKSFALQNDDTKKYLLKGKRLLIQRTTNFEKDIRLKSCIISDEFLEKYNNYFLENHVNYLCSCNGKDELLDIEDMYYYLGLLNSKLLNLVFACKSGNTQVSANELNNLPYPKGEIATISQFMRDNGNNLVANQVELDRLVCRAYGLSEDETDFIINI